MYLSGGHKTVKNILKRGAFTVSMGDAEHAAACDYVGIESGNGVPDMKILSREETLAMEPNLSEKVCGALWAPSAAIVNPWEYALAMTEVAVRNGVELRRSC